MSSQQTDLANLMDEFNTPQVLPKDLEEENIQLKRQVRNLMAEQGKSSAVLNQEIEFLKAQLAEMKEREEKGKTINKNIMDTLQDLNNSAEKRRLSTIAKDELSKAEKQYHRSLSEHKKRSDEENQKLEKENKKLKKVLTEKDAQLKGLRLALGHMEGGYETFKNFMQRNESSFFDDRGSSRSRISTMADDFKDKEANLKILKLEKDLEQIRETVREQQSMRLSETTFESARSRTVASPMLMDNISLSRISHRAQGTRGVSDNDKRSIAISGLDDNSYLKIPNEIYSESGGPISTKSEVLSRKNEATSERVLRFGYNTADHLLSDDMLTPIKRDTADEFQAPKISSFDVIESRVTDFDFPKIREGVHPEINQLFSDREFQYEEQMVYNSRMPKSIPAPSPVQYNTGGQISPIRTEDESEYRDRMEIPKRMGGKPVPVMTNLRLQQQQQKENYDEPVFGRIPGSGYNTERTIYTPRTNEYSERYYEKETNPGMKTEIKFMIGRLMKVKNKIDKQTEQLNLSRISKSPSRNNSISPHSRRNSYAVRGGKGGRPLQESMKMERRYVTENQGRYY